MHIHEKGDGALDYPEAVESCRKMAEQGFAPAQYSVGVFYRDGESAEKDNAKAVKWFRKAAEQGHLAAQESLGALAGEEPVTCREGGIGGT